MTTEPIPAELYVDAPPLSEHEIESLLDSWDDSDEFFDLSPEHPAQRFEIVDDRRAAWAMAKYAAAAAEEAEVLSTFVEYAERIEQWKKANVKRARATMAFFGPQLQQYALARRAADEKRKTLTLPDGVVRTTARPARIVVEKPDEVLAWAKDFLPTVLKTELSQSLLRDELNIVEVPLRAALSCGCIVLTWWDDATPAQVLSRYELASGVECSNCGQEALVGDWLAVTYVAATAAGRVVPGVDVEEPRVSATVSPK